MKKFLTVEDLAKGFEGLAGHFKKAAAHHEAMHKAHAGHAAVAKAKHEGMDDGDVHKAYFKAVHEHHDEMAKLHKAHADHHTEMAAAVDEGEDKAAKAAAVGAAGTATDPTKVLSNTDINASVGALMKDTVAEAVKALKEDTSFKELFKAAVLEEVKKQLGQQVESPAARATIPSAPPNSGVIPIVRPGGAAIDTKDVPAG